jgi:hypothetical protein
VADDSEGGAAPRGDVIDELWAFVAIDPTDGNEGIPAIAAPDGSNMATPLVVADEARLRSLRPKAIELANEYGVTVHLRRFTQRTDVETIEPGKLNPFFLGKLVGGPLDGQQLQIADPPPEQVVIADAKPKACYRLTTHSQLPPMPFQSHVVRVAEYVHDEEWVDPDAPQDDVPAEAPGTPEEPPEGDSP